MFTTKVGKFISEHSNWEELLTSDPYNLRIQRKDNYILLKYSQIDSDFSNDIVKECRGIIFEDGYWEIPICHSFDKFFNYGEPNVAEIDWSNAKVSEKIDGSLIRVWISHQGVFGVSTSGNIDAYDAEYSDLEDCNFGKLFEEGLANYGVTLQDLVKDLPSSCTFMFELVSPKTKVVIPYEKTDIYFLSCRDNVTNTEFPFYVPVYMNETLRKLNKPKVFNLESLEDCVKAAEELPWDNEGYVVCDDNGNRCKIKSPSYVMAHYVRNNNVITIKKLLKVILANEEDEFLVYALDYKDQLNSIKDKMNKFERDCKKAKYELSKINFESRKQYSDKVKRYPKIIQPYLFNQFMNNLTFEEYVKNWTIYAWERIVEAYSDENIEN